MEPDKFARDLTEIIETTLNRFDRRMIASQNRALNSLLDELRNLDRTGTTIKPTVANIRRVQRINARLGRIIFDKRYNAAVTDVINQYEVVRQAINNYMVATFGARFSPERVIFEEVVTNAILLTRDSLFVSHVEGAQSGQYIRQILPELESILNEHVTTGARYSDMLSTVRGYLTGAEGRVGRLVRYTKTWIADTVNQYTANYVQVAARNAGAEIYLYSGGTVEDSREFCISRTGKYWHEREVREWGTIQNWAGRIPGTNPSNIFTLRGGYNCRHFIIPSDIAAARRADIERMKSKGLI